MDNGGKWKKVKTWSEWSNAVKEGEDIETLLLDPQALEIAQSLLSKNEKKKAILRH